MFITVFMINIRKDLAKNEVLFVLPFCTFFFMRINIFVSAKGRKANYSVNPFIV